MSEAAVRTVGLCKRYGARVALEPLELEIGRGQFTALVGSNGAGKTTLLRLLASLIRPSGGEAWLFGLRVERGPGSSAARRRIGFVGHPLLAYRPLSARQNLEFFGRLYGLAEVGARVQDLLQRFGLAGQADDPVGSLSRGQQQRVSLARALLHEPALLLLDEPFSGLDAEGARVVSAALLRAHRSGCTVILATHDLQVASELAGRVAVLRRGRLTHCGAAPGGSEAWADLYRRWAAEAAA